MSEDILEYVDKQRRTDDVNVAMFRNRIFKVSELIHMFKCEKLRFIGGKPFKNWSISHRSRVIENLLFGYPADQVIIDGSESIWYVVDGAEFLSAILDYVNCDFALQNTNFEIADYTGKRFGELTLNLQSRLSNLEITTTVIKPDVSTIHKLGIYNSAMLRIGKGKEFWNCTQVVYPESFNKVHKMANALHIDDPHLLWQILIAVSLPGYLTCKVNDNEFVGGIRFDMFECIVLDQFDLIHDRLRTLKRYEDIVGFIQNTVNDNLLKWSDKKRTIFTLVTAILAYEGLFYKLKDNLLTRFGNAWKKNSAIGKGPLLRDFATKTNVIYNYLKR